MIHRSSCGAEPLEMSKPAKRARTVPVGDWHALEYRSGFNSHVETEAVAGTLPVGQNSPQFVAHGLFAEQVQGSAFTCPRSTNRRSWVYRLAPSVLDLKGLYKARKAAGALTSQFTHVDPNPRRWSPMPLINDAAVDFVDGLQTVCGAGSPSMKDGVAIHMYACNTPMGDRAFCDADGELLVVPQLGVLRVTTEMGRLRVSPGEIFVVPRNLRFTVDPEGEDGDGGGDLRCRGYVLEVFASRGFVLPDLGPLGANGLAEPRDFLLPAAWYEDRACRDGGFVVTTKYAGELFDLSRDYSPYDVVAWHGNYPWSE